MAIIREIVTDAMVELGVLDAIEVPTAEDAQWMLRKFVRLVDRWNAFRPAVFAEVFTTFSFVASQQDYTVGPGANIVLALRPVTLDGANAILNNVSPVVRVPINLRDWQWWRDNSVRTITSDFPTDVYYEPAWPVGILHFWPKPTVAYGGEIVTRTLINEAVTLDTTFSMPQGYKDALTYTLAEESWNSFPDVDARVLQKIEQLAMKARAVIFANNDKATGLVTRDAGMPSSAGSRPNFNWRTGLMKNQ